VAGVAAAVVMVVALIVGGARPVGAQDAEIVEGEDPQLAELRVALDELVGRERPDGGWTFATLPGERVHPHTTPLRFAERVAAPFGLADWDIIVLRSPGTPAAIMALLKGYAALGVERYLASAIRAGDLLVALQMRSGGWFSEMPARGRFPVAWFRWTVLRTAIDDDVTPGAIRALLALWQETKQDAYRTAAERGIDLLLDRQLPQGAWPLVARPRWKQMLYRDFEDRPTLNDGATTQSILTMLMAARVLGRPELVARARRGGDWIVRAQHAAPQAGWAQQYDELDRPAPARRYERVALASWETRYAIDALVTLAEATGTMTYCAPVAPAARWLAASQTSPGCWARFYELDTNTPLYFNERREIVGSPTEAHQPYDWTGDFGIRDLLLRLTGGPYRDENGGPIPGDPGHCPNPSAAPFDPKTATDPRHVIAYAARLADALEPRPVPPPACRFGNQ
jgi:hypothetical protein